ncbi:putative mitochondrial protein [Cucumis melo var. makuwa]|uniref:Mitochondrial protein n=1 Tax=Cucumis melo var. makuwa TaxID=1194695 RepID=A0A5A7T9M6_CUCMM|nr:putative mitochondrial protein [Cucumis melo var. makuwa]
MTDSIGSHISNRMSGNDRFRANSVNIHTDKGKVDENEKIVESTEKETKQDHPGNIRWRLLGLERVSRKYNLDLLAEIGMIGCCLADTPTEFNVKLRNSGDMISVDKEKYQISPMLVEVQEDRQKVYVLRPILTLIGSKKQEVGTRSSVEVECRATSLGI